jgi:hypothetical protein
MASDIWPYGLVQAPDDTNTLNVIDYRRAALMRRGAQSPVFDRYIKKLRDDGSVSQQKNPGHASDC